MERRTGQGKRPISRGDRERRLRLAFLEGAEEQSRRALGRGLTLDELERIITRFPGVAADR